MSNLAVPRPGASRCTASRPRGATPRVAVGALLLALAGTTAIWIAPGVVALSAAPAAESPSAYPDPAKSGTTKSGTTKSGTTKSDTVKVDTVRPDALDTPATATAQPDPGASADPGDTPPDPGPGESSPDAPTPDESPKPTSTSSGATTAPTPDPSDVSPTTTESAASPPRSPTPSAERSSASPSPTRPESASAVPAPSVTPQRPATPPAAADSKIPLTMVLAALVVLLIAGGVLRLVAVRSRGRKTPPGVPLDATVWLPRIPAPGQPDSLDATVRLPRIPAPGQPVPPLPGGPVTGRAVTHEAQTMSFLVALGQAMVESGDPVTHVNASLTRVAAANGVEGAEILVMPTAMFVSVPSGDSVQTEVAAAGRASLRLDQVDSVFEVARAAENGEIGPVEGMDRLERARSAPPTFSRRAQWLGYMGFTLGLSMIMMASPTEMALAVVLGAGVGLLDWWASRFPQPFQVFLPVVSAFAVAIVVFVLGRAGLDVSGFSSLLAPLVILIPGALLTTGVIELATGQIISGSARLAAGLMRLTLLALGILAAGQLVGMPAMSTGEVDPNPLGQAGQWLGVAVFGVGIVINRCARRGALPWILLVLYVAYAGQVVGGLFLGEGLAAFAGAALMTPVALFVAAQQSGPTMMVSFLPGFWLLVPGAVGLAGVTRLLGDNQELGMESMISMGATMVSIALGVLLGLALVGALAAIRDVARGRAATGLLPD